MRQSSASRAAVRSTARRIAVAAASAVLLVGPLTTTAHAAPAEQLPAPELPAELVEALQRDLNLSPEQYLERAARAQELGDYARSFRAERPSDFAGAWLGEDGQPVVAVTNSEAARRAQDDGYQATVAPVSADGLEQALAELNRWVSALPRDVSSQVNNTSIDVLNNQIVIDIVNSPVGRALNLPSLIANVQVQLSPGLPANDPAPLGGDTYITADGDVRTTPLDRIGICSFGFNGVDGNGDAVNLTAGHCDAVARDQGGSTVYLPNRSNIDDSTKIGTFTSSTVGTDSTLDYGVISLDKAGVDAGLTRPAVRGGNGSTLTVTGTAVPVVGAPVCKSGQSSSFTCGVVAADRIETQLIYANGTASTIRGFATTACTLSGDSGGAIVTGTLALGVISGSNSAGAPDCVEANLVLAPNGGTSSLGISVQDIEAATGARVRTAANPA
ncbi:S1 family peptidase [Rhodococcus chondri]|uniref:S1 family peptidase n=1 Tax=Rhodococcus chondri TaxID=3065941 RepID=A0ABU7JWA7_9NOCA|nr:S1 family peptidase [Rhodococcus sp. CC-R104]MEE2034306.1 S1 family peptidase [Rhodococcus sp. CC-R104]